MSIDQRFTIRDDIPEGYRLTHGGRLIPDAPAAQPRQQEEGTILLGFNPAWVERWKDFNRCDLPVSVVAIPLSFVVIVVLAVCTFFVILS